MDTVKIDQPMPEPNKCPQCGTALPSGALAGLCPACLLKMGAATDTVTDAKQKSFTPPPIPELVSKFPQLEILELIGKGGMGAVYKARQKQLDRIVALKILPPGIGDEAAFAERFAREAKALAKLNHPNIVTLYEFGDAGGQFYFLMEFVDGVNLRQLLHAGRISSREALAIVPQICDALQFAHDQGIVHRDIKPENILMDRRGRVKVADFGLAKIVEGRAGSPLAAEGVLPTDVGTHGVTRPTNDLTDVGKVIGTPQYMSPEQIQAPGEVDHRADIYALGVVFYQMLTGELPGKKIAPPSTKVQIDVRLDEIVLRALAKNPELRYQQVSEVKTCVETIASTPAPSEPAVSRWGFGYISSPKHLQSFYGTFCYIYEGKGRLQLDAAELTYSDHKDSVCIPLHTIREINIGQYPRFAKPLGLDYISVTYAAGEIIRTRLFTPSTSPFALTWNTNQLVAEWFYAIQAAQRKVQTEKSVSETEKLEPKSQASEDVVGHWSQTLLFLAAMPVLVFLIYTLATHETTRPKFFFGILWLPILFFLSILGGMQLRGGLRKVNKVALDGTRVVSEPRFSRTTKKMFLWLLLALALVVIFLGLKVHHQISGIDKIVANPFGDNGTRELRNPPFVARLNQGEVELLAIGDQPWTNTVCWLANGAPSDKLFPTSGFGSMDSWAESKVTKKIAFRIHNESSEGFSYPIGRDTNDPEVGIVGSGLSWPVRYGDASFIQLVTCPTNAQTMNFSLGVANGKWETAITLKHASDMNNGLGSSESFNSPTEGEWSATYNAVAGRGAVAINCNYSKNTNWASRMVGVDDDGKITVIPENSSSVSSLSTGGILLVSSNEFARIKEFQLQRRKYQWVEFRNVSLQLGHATKVTVKDFGGAIRDDAALLSATNSLPALTNEERVNVIYVIARGDTVAGIARKFGMSLVGLKALNPALQATRIRIGQQVMVSESMSVQIKNSMTATTNTVSLENPPATPNLSFGPVIERTLPFNDDLQGAFLDLETGQLLSPPPDIAALFKTPYNTRLSWEDKSDPRAGKMQEWLRTSGANLMAWGGEDAERLEMREGVAIQPPWTGTNRVGFDQTDPKVVATQTNVFLKPLQTNSVIKIFLLQPGYSPELGLRQDTFQFMTRKGTIGVLQILNTEDNPPGVKIRYKLVQQNSTTDSPTNYPGDWIWEMNSSTLAQVPPIFLLRPSTTPTN
jgi:serine/threonine protein kinase/LysM repeat protein